MNTDTPTTGQVILVGGGPGDPDLLTIGGLRALREADVVLHDHLAPLACLDQTRPGATLIDVGKIPRGCQAAQTDINALLIDHARRGRTVVRFKGGDPFVLGRGSEEWLACAEPASPSASSPECPPRSPDQNSPASPSPTAASPRTSPSSPDTSDPTTPPRP